MEVKAIRSVKFPVKGVRAYIEANIVKNDLPLLLSHESMKTVGMLLDLKNDSCQILGRYIKLQSMTSEHYSLPLTNMSLEVQRPANVVLHCKDLKKILRVEERRKAEKLQK